MSNKTSTTKEDVLIKSEPKMVEVREDKLKKILSKIEILEDTVSKQRLKESGERHDKTFLLQGFLKRLKGEVIMGWYPMEKRGAVGQTVYDEDNKPIEIEEKDSKAEMEIIYRDNVPVGEKLIGHYKAINGKDIICDAKEFYRSNAVEKFDRLKDEGQFWIVRFHNPALPQKFRLNINFINP